MSETNHNRPQQLEAHLQFLCLHFMLEQHENLARQAATEHWTHLHYLDCLAQGEVSARHDRAITSAILDRLLHHAESIHIDGKSYRMKDHWNS